MIEMEKSERKRIKLKNIVLKIQRLEHVPQCQLQRQAMESKGENITTEIDNKEVPSERVKSHFVVCRTMNFQWSGISDETDFLLKKIYCEVEK